MKVYVMSKERRAALCEWWQASTVADDFCAAMTSIDIPDGCQLAVVEKNDYPVGVVKVVDDQVTRAYRETSRYEQCKFTGYRRVVQVVEVKG